MIKIEGLSKFYGKNQILYSLNIEFEKGKTYGIVGENGAGKTTLFRCISGLENYQGKIFSDYKKLKNHLGLLLTEPYFLHKITGKEYIQLLANSRQIQLVSIEEKNIFDLPLNQYASNYSTGMKKKLALTAILLQENDVFILDEPFNGVDIQSNLIITDIIKELKRLNKTVLISSHIFSTLAETCDEIFLMKSGKIIKKVNHANFKKLEIDMKQFSIGNRINKLNLK
ncbi:ATP-binding cassette domain-containing protein [Cellulophaga baltica]|uniref:ABC transporter ATP-binding protein n=1 Tax=Cellulophaga TaxID=104264 RepID=UPI001C0775C9|nr:MULTISPECIES: ATP-binding cassette domain-containing protein [Cellulophaga]MBU2997911.1 ATP-binding cassette domain-containing protein [Cellulophaga baltica]MDO6769312.1 ATP-binding cassette domain-containing protein [Cellulophaga sp. 1_MG-2023]